MAEAIGSGASKTVTEEQPLAVPIILTGPTAIPGAVGVTKRGPINVATLIQGWDDFVRIFGGDDANSDLAHAVRGFYREAGQGSPFYVVRVVHYTDIDNPAAGTADIGTLDLLTGATAPTSGSSVGTALAPFDLTAGDTLVVSVDGGGNLTATFSATAAARESGAETYALSNGQTLTVAIDLGVVQTITFVTGNFVAIGAATAEEVAAVINAQIVGAHATVTSGGTKVTITSDRLGTGSNVNVTGGTANGALGFTTGALAGTGNVSNIDAVTFAEVKTIVEAAVAGVTVTDAGSGAVRITSNTTGTSSSVLVVASSTADDELGFDNATHSGSTGAAQNTLTVDGKTPGDYANVVKVRIEDASNGEAASFDLSVVDDGVVSQKFANLTMDPTSARYVVTIVNADVTGSPLIALTDLGLTGTAAQRRPTNGLFGPLTGGDDGLTSLADTDFEGSSASATGFYALDLLDQVRVLLVPGRATGSVHNAMTSYCEVWRAGSMFAVLDPPADQTAAEIVTYVESTAALLESSEYGAIFWPRVKVTNPNKGIFGSDDNIVVPPSGHIAGVFSRVDGSSPGGVYQPAAGVERGILTSITGFETDEVLNVRRRDLIYPKRINPLCTGKGGSPRMIDGTRTLKSTGDFPSISERRGVISIEQALKDGLEFARHSNNDPALRRRCDRAARLYLTKQMKLGAFRSTNPDTAFFVDFSDELNPDAVIFENRLEGAVGLATNKPAEFVRIRVSQDTRALEAATG